MALRLTGSPATPAPLQPVEAAARAAVCLDRRDLDGYRTLFAEASAIADVHARYRTRASLVEAALRAAGDADRARVPAIYLAAAAATVELLEEEPREPLLLNYAGVLFYELWALDAARALFEAARRLDPELPNVARNLEELAHRRTHGAAARIPLPRAIAVALGPLGARAERAARRARPATGLTLSRCMIVKDEEEMLPRCLAAVASAVDEIVIVDTGSSDRTIEIARSFGARVIERPWTGSFADARNASFDAATGDWLMYLDADEVLVADDVERLRALRGKTWREAFYLVETSYTGEVGDGAAATHTALRVFRSRPAYRFSGRLHEQIAETLPTNLPERFESTSVRVEHFGYLGAVRDAKEKSRRNIDLLLRQRDEGGVELPFLHFNLGSEYAAIGDAPNALREFELAWQLLESDPGGRTYGFAPALATRLVKALRICRRHEDAIARAEDGLERFPGMTDLVFEQAAAAHALGRVEEALAHYEQCIEMGDAPSRYTATVGAGTFLPALAIAEIRLDQGRMEEAVELLDATIAEHPGFFGLVLPFATALLLSGVEPAEVVARVEARVAELTPTVRFMLGTALYERGATAAAEQQYRALLERQPDSGMALVALAESLLAQRSWAGAASIAARVPDDAPHAAAARRSELFGAIVGGDLDRARALLARGAESSLPAAEQALFGAWCELAGDAATTAAGDAPATLPLAAVPLLAVALEALLRVQEVDAFGLLVPLLDRCPIDPRERRELLAGMYLRRGFLASAAEEWMAVCERVPDARALVGLASVAAAQGMADDALTFAREARALDPEDMRATRLLERLAPVAA
jgi:tetratricopeptide (TPR) repeat protein